MDELISVIVPIYKVEVYLDECIASIVAQTYTNLDIILVDDGSPDNCPQMCDKWAAIDSRIKVIHKKNGGISDARNAGINIAAGDYIAFVDSDDWIAPDMYKKMLSAIQNESADICACGVVNAYPDRHVPWNIPVLSGTPEEILEKLYQDTTYPVAAWNKLYTRKCWDGFRFPVGKICEDAFTTCFLLDKVEKIVQIKDNLYFYRIRENSIMTSPFSSKRMDEEEAWRCNYLFVQQHYPKLYKTAFDFYLQKVNILLHAIPKEQHVEFSEEHQKLHDILRENMCYILFSSKLSLKKRIKLLTDYFTL